MLNLEEFATLAATKIAIDVAKVAGPSFSWENFPKVAFPAIRMQWLMANRKDSTFLRNRKVVENAIARIAKDFAEITKKK